MLSLLIPFVHHPGSAASTVHCPYCPAVLGGEEEMQEHISSQHVSQSSKAFSCPLCSLVCTSQLEMQEHLLSCHMETQEEQEAGEEQASTSHTVRSSAAALKSNGKYSTHKLPACLSSQPSAVTYWKVKLPGPPTHWAQPCTSAFEYLNYTYFID